MQARFGEIGFKLSFGRVSFIATPTTGTTGTGYLFCCQVLKYFYRQ